MHQSQAALSRKFAGAPGRFARKHEQDWRAEIEFGHAIDKQWIVPVGGLADDWPQNSTHPSNEIFHIPPSSFRRQTFRNYLNSPEGGPKSRIESARERRRYLSLLSATKEDIMAKKDKDSVYKIVEVVGTSTKSWADAGRKAVETAAGTLRELRIAEVVKLDMAIENGKVRAYRARVALSFKIDS
jgi:dodecin